MKPASPQINVRNLQRKVPVSAVDLEIFGRKAVQMCLGWPAKRKTDLNQLAEVSILIVSDRRISLLHRRFLNQSGPTDVITFQHGEVFISAEMARRQANQFGTSLEHELRLYLVHGLLHLHGYDDRDKAGAERMGRIQKKILDAVEKGRR